MQSIARRLAAPTFMLALFSSAALIFVLQPLFARMVTPLLGGSPAVWNTSMAFFQAALLVGYLYAHLLARLKDLRVQAIVHGLVLVGAWLVLPVQVSEAMGPPRSEQPVWWLIGVLTFSVGAPFAAASATAPLLQAWYARTGRADAHDPYYLYAASNLGSFIGLLGYPILIEPLLGAQAQSAAWSAGYVTVVALIALAAATALSANGAAQKAQSPPSPAPSWRQRGYWIAAAAVPSALSLGVTLHISTDVASAPMLWVIPLALYLLTFVIAFARGSEAIHRATLIIQPAAAAWLIISSYANENWLGAMLGALAGFFFSALLCHLALSRARPHAQHLTEFYLYISLGGVLGGAFAALVAPLIFNNVYEYPLALAAACLFRPRTATARGRGEGAAFGAAIAAGLLAVLLAFWAPPAPTIVLGALGAAAALLATTFGGGERPGALRYAALASAAAQALVAIIIAFNIDTMLVRTLVGDAEQLALIFPWNMALMAASFLVLAFALHTVVQRRDGSGVDFAHGFAAFSALLLIMLALLGQRLDTRLLTATGIAVCGSAILLNWRRPLAMALAVLIAFFIIFLDDARGGRIITQMRTFFGVLRVRELPATDLANGPVERILRHGTIIHGAQLATPGYTRQPLTYYNPNTALGEAVLAGLSGSDRASIALIGLGTGATACLTRPSDQLVIFEIDPSVVQLSGRPGGDFTYVPECQPGARIELGDARLQIAEEPDGAFDVIVVDAFSSDAIPAHLLTREAVALYLAKASEQGIVVLHLSNRNLALVSEAARVARDLNAPTLYRMSPRLRSPYALGGLAASVMVVARSPSALARVALASTDWRVLTSPPGRAWSDDYVNIPRAFWDNLNGAEDCRLWPETCARHR